jgi:hypothetical protein
LPLSASWANVDLAMRDASSDASNILAQADRRP